MVERRGVPLWWWWIVLVFVVSAPWIGFTPEPQWDRLHLVPFSDPEDKPRDVATNVLMFVPFGYSYFKHREGRHRLLATLGLAIVVSVIAEVPQLFSTLRNPSATDVAMAALGAGTGAAGRWLREQWPPTRGTTRRADV
jgi:glycopeptide antibiotics resistance protein